MSIKKYGSSLLPKMVTFVIGVMILSQSFFLVSAQDSFVAPDGTVFPSPDSFGQPPPDGFTPPSPEEIEAIIKDTIEQQTEGFIPPDDLFEPTRSPSPLPEFSPTTDPLPDECIREGITNHEDCKRFIANRVDTLEGRIDVFEDDVRDFDRFEEDQRRTDAFRGEESRPSEDERREEELRRERGEEIFPDEFGLFPEGYDGPGDIFRDNFPPEGFLPEGFPPGELFPEGFVPPDSFPGRDDFPRPGDFPSAADFQPNIFLPPPCTEAGVTDPEECKKVMFAQHAPPECRDAGVTSEEDCKRIVVAKHLPPECQEAGFTSPEECERFMFKQFAPPECREADVDSPEQCEELLFEKFAPPVCSEAGLTDPRSCERHLKENVMPQECEAAGITDDQECERHAFKKFAPQECLDRGATSPDECERVMIAAHLPPECEQAGATTREQCEGVMFKKFGPPECIAAGLTTEEECESIMFAQHAPRQCVEAGATTPSECERVMFQEFAPPECREAGTTDESSCRKTLFKVHAPPECLEQGATSPEECEQIMLERHLPEACRAVGASTPEACEQLMVRKHMPPECLDLGLEDPHECEIHIIKARRLVGEDGSIPDFCEKKGITDPEECQEEIKRGHVPPECREVGAFTRHACEQVLFEKYHDAESLAEGLPVQCEEEGITDPTACRDFLKKDFFPRECEENGITSEEQCRGFLQARHFPPKCLEAGVDSIEACEELIRSVYLGEECLEQGIVDTRACEQFMVERYAGNVHCEGIDGEQCQFAVQKRVLGRLVERRRATHEITKRVEEFVGGHIDESDSEDIADVLPVEVDGDIVLSLHAAGESTVITEDEEIVDVVPIVATIDSDVDGLPDDIEDSIGSDPHNADTDGDGISDGDEVAAGDSPVGDGSLDLEPTEVAIISDDVTLEQPISEGEVSEDLVIEETEEPTETDSGDGEVQGAKVFAKGERVHLTGRGLRNRTYALYIYSQMAIVSTVSTDASGEWDFTLDATLQEGEHEAYLVELASDGEILSKSKPFSFLVGTAMAQAPGSVDLEDSEEADGLIAPPLSADPLVYVIALVLVLLIITATSFILHKVKERRG